MRYDRAETTGKEDFSLIFLYLWLLALAATGVWAALASSLSVWSLLGVLALSFLAANLLFVLTFTVNSMLLPKLAPGEGIEKQHSFSRWICASAARWLCGYAGVRVHLSGLEQMPEGPFLFVCNHRSMFDPAVVMGYLDKYNISFISVMYEEVQKFVLVDKPIGAAAGHGLDEVLFLSEHGAPFSFF